MSVFFEPGSATVAVLELVMPTSRPTTATGHSSAVGGRIVFARRAYISRNGAYGVGISWRCLGFIVPRS
jgi:hypothetical protein